jgi:hypothetical protein
MRKILFVTAALLVAGFAGAGPSTARQGARQDVRQDTWCARLAINDGNPQCDFSTYRQCQATISGVGGDCIRNPAMAYNRMQGNVSSNNGSYSSGGNNPGSGWDHNNWHDNGWNNNRSW